MASSKLPYRRVHTGDRVGDAAQLQAQQAASALNRLSDRVEPLLATIGRETRGLKRIYMKDADYRLPQVGDPNCCRYCWPAPIGWSGVNVSA